MNKAQIKLLTRIAEGSASSDGYLMAATGSISSSLVTLGYIEVNAGITSGKGKVAQRITQAGHEALAVPAAEVAVDNTEEAASVPPQPQSIEAQQTPVKEHTMSQFEISDNIDLPARTSTKTEKYPFSVLELGQSFAVPHVDGKAMISPSTVTGANTRHRKLGTGRYFRSRVLVEDGVDLTRVWRCEAPAPKAEVE